MQVKMESVLVSESEGGSSTTSTIVNSSLRSGTSVGVRNSQGAATPQQTVLFTAPQQVKHILANSPSQDQLHTHSQTPSQAQRVRKTNLVLQGTQTLAVQQANGNVSIVHVQIPQGQSVIQPATTAQASVIQATSAGAIQSIGKNQVILVNKGSVIQSTPGGQGNEDNSMPVQLVTSAGNVITTADFSGTLGEDEGTRKRREILARRPSYRKILNDLSGMGSQGEGNSIPSLQDLLAHQVVAGSSSSEKDDASDSDYQLKPSQTIQLQATDISGQQYVQYTNDAQLFVPVTVSAADLQAYQIRPGGSMATGSTPVVVQQGSAPQTLSMAEEAARKRGLRLLKNREAAKECRRKKKDYIKCLENRVAVLENQNATLIEELKALKDLYCKKSVADV